MAKALPARVLVTGAHGLVGRVVVTELSARGVDVVRVVRKPSSSDRREVVVDLRQPAAALLRSVEAAPSAVVHLAAAVPHWPQYSDNDSTAAATRAMDLCVGNAVRVWQSHFIYASTCGLYDLVDSAWKSEATAVTARSPYFRAKLEGEELALARHATILRISSVYGSGMSPSLVLPRFLDLARRDAVIEVWGDGTREQDFIAAADVADAVVASLATRARGVFNIASGHPMTMVGLAKLVTEAIGAGRVALGRKGDPLVGQTARFRIDKAGLELAWRPVRDLATEVRSLAEQTTA